MSGARPHHEILENGLGVILLETHEAPVAAVQIWAAVGSADEQPGEEGLAHFHEHMLFKGTRRRGVGEIAGEIEGEGGRINAYTSYDLTVYHATLPSAKAGVGLDVLADAVRASVFDPAEIEREIEVVLEEIRRYEDAPARVLEQATMREAYRVHPYRNSILGTRESVASLDQERLLAFFRRWYAPDNLTVVAAGDFDAAELRERIRDAFAGATPEGVRRSRPAEPPQSAPRSLVLRRDFERAYLELSFPAVPLAHPDAPLLDLVAFILGQGDSSRLVRRVKEREGLVDGIDASCYTPLDPGVFSVSADLDPANLSDAIRATMRELERLRRGLVPAGELEKARANFLAHEHFERESMGGQARKLGTFHLLAGSYDAEAAYLEAVRCATPGDLMRVAHEHLAEERVTIGGLLPEDAAPGFDAAAAASALHHGAEETARVFAVPARLASARPRTGAAARPGSEVISYRLENGAHLHVTRRPEVPIAALRSASLGGLLSEDAGRAGLTGFTAAMWLRGTGSRSAEDFARSVESLAAEIDVYSGRNSLGLTLESTRDVLDPALDLFAEVLLDPAFDAAELERERRDTLAAIERREDHLASRAMLLFVETHYRSHPYRLSMLGTRESVSGFTRDAVAAHHARLVRAHNLVIGAAGDVDPDELAVRLSSLLADLDGGAFDPPAPPEEPAPAEIRTAELRKPREQAHLVLGFRGVTVRDGDRFALEVLSQMLAGQSGRLFLELRDRQSLAYTVNAVNVEGVAPGFFAIYIATAPDKTDQARSGILKELERLLDGPPPADEVARAARHLVGNHTIDQQRRAVRAAHLALDSLYGLGPEADLEYAERIQAVTPEEIVRVARRVLRLDAYTLAVIRP